MKIAFLEFELPTSTLSGLGEASNQLGHNSANYYSHTYTH